MDADPYNHQQFDLALRFVVLVFVLDPEYDGFLYLIRRQLLDNPTL